MTEFSVLAALIVGYVWQWARGPKHLPTWIANIVFAVVALGVFWLSTKDTPDLSTIEGAKAFVVSLVMWVASCLGLGTLSADAKAAPRTNAIDADKKGVL